jgi:hypothetical protein
MQILTKHPGESRRLAFDFSGASIPGPTRRGNVISEALATVALATAVSVTATRDDGEASDLTLGSPSLATPVVSVTASGGTAGRRYTLTCIATTATETLVMQAAVCVAGELP